LQRPYIRNACDMLDDRQSWRRLRKGKVEMRQCEW